MAERGRKSAASLSVVVGAIDGRPKPPNDLTKFQTTIWERTVANEAADMFKTAALQQLLREYCRHSETADYLSAAIAAQQTLAPAEAMALEDFDRLLKMRDREVRAITTLATKLRITNQSRYTAEAAGTKARKEVVERKPWQMAG